MNLVFRAPCASFRYRDVVLVQMAFWRWGEAWGSESFIQQLLSPPLYMLNTILGARGTAVYKTKSLPFGANISCGGRETMWEWKTISEWCVLWWIKTPLEPGGPSLLIKSSFWKRLWWYFCRGVPFPEPQLSTCTAVYLLIVCRCTFHVAVNNCSDPLPPSSLPAQRLAGNMSFPSPLAVAGEPHLPVSISPVATKPGYHTLLDSQKDDHLLLLPSLLSHICGRQFWGRWFSFLSRALRITWRELLLAQESLVHHCVYRRTVDLPCPSGLVYRYPNLKRKLENDCLLHKKILNLTKGFTSGLLQPDSLV